MKIKTFAGLALIALVFSPLLASAQEFLPYEGKNAIQEGEGGTKKVINGIDFWADGAPPRTFKLLGYITDRRHKTGLIGMVRMSGLESDVADTAKKNGGDAVILVSSDSETVGAIGNSFGSAHGTANTVGDNTTIRATGRSSTFSAPVQKQQSKFAVVKYVERETRAAIDLPLKSTSDASTIDETKKASTPATQQK